MRVDFYQLSRGPVESELPPLARIGQLYAQQPAAARRATRLHAQIMRKMSSGTATTA